MTRRSLPLVCPSSNIDEPRAKLLGVPTPDGGLVFAKEPIPVTPEFVRIAKQGRDPSKRFRFTSPCIRTGCVHWRTENAHCSLADVVTNELSPADEAEPALPSCPIRPTCRWYVQRGNDACRACSSVIAHMFFAEEPSTDT